MSQTSPPAWQKVALETLLRVLDPEPVEAWKAYIKLFNEIVAFCGDECGSDPRKLAEKTLAKVAEDVYVRLTGLRREDLNRTDIVHEVPHVITPEVYAAERELLPDLAISYAKSIRLEREIAKALESHDLALAREALEKEALEFPWENDLERLKHEIEQALLKTLAEVHFTAYYPRSFAMLNWSTMLAYMHVAGALPSVQADSQRRLGEAGKRTGSKTTTNRVDIARGARILVVPQSEGLEFNPSQVDFAWLEDFHCAEFRCRIRSDVKADSKPQGIPVTIAFYVPPVLVAEISFTVSVSRESKQKRQTASVTSHPYQRVFVSYSREDTSIADQLGEAYKALGLEYLRDVNVLRSGEKWAPALLDLIDKSEIFQLLWSEAAKCSPYVRQEWQHALGLDRNFFIRPVYWEKPMPTPPPELADIHFAYLELIDRGDQ